MLHVSFQVPISCKGWKKMRRSDFPWKMDGYLSSPLISVLERWIGTNNSPTHLCCSKLWFLGCRNLPNRCKKLHPKKKTYLVTSQTATHPQFVSLSYHAGLLWLLLSSRVSESSLKSWRWWYSSFPAKSSRHENDAVFLKMCQKGNKENTPRPFCWRRTMVQSNKSPYIYPLVP